MLLRNISLCQACHAFAVCEKITTLFIVLKFKNVELTFFIWQKMITWSLNCFKKKGSQNGRENSAKKLRLSYPFNKYLN